MQTQQRTPTGPSPRTLLLLVLGAIGAHALVLLGMTAPLQVRLSSVPPSSSVQVRMVPLPPPQAPRPAAKAPRPPSRPALKPPSVSAPVPQPAPEPAPEPPLAQAAQAETPLTEATSSEVPQTDMPEPAQAAASEPDPKTPLHPQDASPQAIASASAEVNPVLTPPTQAQPAAAEGSAWPIMPPGALPPSQLLNYQLTGMDKGLTYHASGELRWQHNPNAYALSLSVRAFLIGRREWRSTGQIDARGLSPMRFSDSWRRERAAHFDREQQRVVFSSNSTPAPLQAGAQDQVSLYVQLAAALSADPQRFVPGTPLQVQTVTVRDALPWSLVLEGTEALTLGAQTLPVSKWVCQPRNRFEARVEFWVSQAHAWMPLRIRITQASGSYIDLLWRDTEPLPPLPVAGDASATTGGS